MFGRHTGRTDGTASGCACCLSPTRVRIFPTSGLPKRPRELIDSFDPRRALAIKPSLPEFSARIDVPHGMMAV